MTNNIFWCCSMACFLFNYLYKHVCRKRTSQMMVEALQIVGKQNTSGQRLIYHPRTDWYEAVTVIFECHASWVAPMRVPCVVGRLHSRVALLFFPSVWCCVNDRMRRVTHLLDGTKCFFRWVYWETLGWIVQWPVPREIWPIRPALDLYSGLVYF